MFPLLLSGAKEAAVGEVPPPAAAPAAVVVAQQQNNDSGRSGGRRSSVAWRTGGTASRACGRRSGGFMAELGLREELNPTVEVSRTNLKHTGSQVTK